MRYKYSIFLVIILGFCFTTSKVAAVIRMTDTPLWESSDKLFATGGALIDLDGDGYLELITSNGNDIIAQNETVYRNTAGIMAGLPYWQSGNVTYSGHLAAGDIDSDGYTDFVMGTLGDDPAWTPGPIKMYRGVAGGGFELMPSWVSDTVHNTFHVALGDVDGDGDLDLAAANGDYYVRNPQANEIYLNSGGVFETSPSWVSSDIDSTFDVTFGDIDNDGDLDLAAANIDAPHRVYYNVGGVLETSASWSSDEIEMGNTAIWGDVDGDGDLDLVVSNMSTSPPGNLRLYENLGGVLGTSSVWVASCSTGQCSSVAFADVDHDGDLDLGAGSWFGGSIIFENLGGALEASASWKSGLGYESTVENVMFGDIDTDGIYRKTTDFDGDGKRKLFYLPNQPLHDILDVNVDGRTLAADEFCADIVQGWISLATAPSAGVAVLTVTYELSRDLELVVTNWDPDRGNYIFDNQTVLPVPSCYGKNLLFLGLVFGFFLLQCLYKHGEV